MSSTSTNWVNAKMASREDERGITIVLVAVVIVVVLGMAALAIDLTALYVSHGQAQRAADAAALAGAKMFVNSGFTSNPSAWTTTDLCQTGGPGLVAAANQQAEAAAGANRISGQPVSVQHIACNLTTPTNPRITVKVQQAGLPSYFARIWGQQSNSVGASATAEAYNPSGSAVAIQTPVKPWLIPNCDPGQPGCVPLINVTDGSIANNGSFIDGPINLKRTPNIASAPTKGQYYTLDIGLTPPPLCPSSSAVSCGNVNASAYTENVACASQVPLACGQQAITLEDIPVATTSDVAKCMIHARNYGSNQGYPHTCSGQSPRHYRWR
jgi:Tfp pilus assembly protein PilX